MELFSEVIKDIYLLKIPFGPVWTGVVLVRDGKNTLIDSGSRGRDVDQYIVPALAGLGMTVDDIDYLVNTHSHGDHMGGNARLRQLGRFQLAAYETAVLKIENPVPYAIRTRTRFPAFSPAPQCELQGVSVDLALKDGESLTDSLQVIHTPGHDDECVCWYDTRTGTLIAGDSLQANGTICQGIGFYKSLREYRKSLARLNGMEIENILCGHDYDGIGYLAAGREQARRTLAVCGDCVEQYDRLIRQSWEEGCREPVELARRLIRECGCGEPEHLFMALYTVTQHVESGQL